ncbi:MAG TPA: 16S rRNA (guanine(966)-N(2))-methyltransferase RsmD [Nitrospirae bacterium]|nr:16S rRNA (guanine(966)-N(2))-methyltransferase RsmD [Nitrospirota bacterium]
MRIIGGEQKGRVIRLKKSLINFELRPTSHKVRKALFDIIGTRIIDAVFLDLFSGTGAIGFEAFSRGAKKVVFVESKRTLINNINKFSKQTEIIKNIEIVNEDCLKFLKTTDECFDIIFADPPYYYEKYDELFSLINNFELLKDKGLFVIEHSSKKNIFQVISNMEFIKSYKYGDTSLSFFKKGGVKVENSPLSWNL